MAKKQEIRITTVYDGKQTDKQAFVRLMIEKYRLAKNQAYIDENQANDYTNDGLK